MYQEPSRIERSLRDVWPIIKTGIFNVVFFFVNIVKYIVSEGIKMVRNQY